MTNFLIRRFFQIIIVVLLSAVVSYALLNLAPGGPLLAFQQMQRGGPDAPTDEDLVRIRERFELDLYLPVRFTRWLVGLPRGPLEIGGQSYFADVQVGCAIPGRAVVTYADGRQEVIEMGCDRPVTMADLEGRRTSDGILFGDLGRSQVISREQPVTDVIGSRLWYTVVLMGASIAIAILIAIPIGIYSAVRQYSFFDYTMTTLAFIGSSLPSFFFGIMAILIFAILAQDAGLPYLPAGNAVANRDYVVPWIGSVEAGSVLDQILHFIMPCAVLVFINLATWSRFIRSSMLEVLHQDYIKTARAKGVRERLVILKHGFRNALIPFITLLAGILPNLFAGAAITEAVFNWPGLGRLLLDALERNDYSVVMALLYITIVLQLIGYLISDMLYTAADPRIRLS